MAYFCNKKFEFLACKLAIAAAGIAIIDEFLLYAESMVTLEGYSANEILLKWVYKSVKKFKMVGTSRFGMPV